MASIDRSDRVALRPSMKSNRGSILLMTLCLVTALALTVYAVYALANATYRMSQRNEYRARAKAVANSELEYIFFQLESTMMSGTAAQDVPTAPALSSICDIPTASYLTANPAQAFTPSTTRDPFAVPFQNTPEHWKVRRSIAYNSISTHGTTSIYNYFTVKVEVISGPGSPFDIDVRYGRNMNSSLTSIFQYNIFSEGNLEFAPSGTTQIDGDIASNGTISMGPRSGGTLNINAYVYYLNAAPTELNDGFGIDTSRIVDSGTSPITLNTSGLHWGTSEAAQVQQVDQPKNLIGGLNAAELALQYGTGPSPTNLFGAVSTDSSSTDGYNDVQLNAAENRVYRSVIAPPPKAVYDALQQGSNGTASSEYPDATLTATTPDDPGIAALRAYNRAGLILTVNGDGSWAITAPGTTLPVATSVTPGNFANVVTTSATMFDLREQKSVAIADIDVGNLTQAITNSVSSLPSGKFNGVLYVYLAKSSATFPAAVRLSNASATPGYQNVGSTDPNVQAGFTMATNGGLYVKGDYNTQTTAGLLTDPATGVMNTDAQAVVNPAVLMADAITILSNNWRDSNVVDSQGHPITDPVATAGVRLVNPPDSGQVTHATIASGLLTGNTAQDSSGATIYSGGGENLVRFLEDWNYNENGDTVNFYGSFGCLFQSSVFNSPFQPGWPSFIYNNPGRRFYSFNSSLKGAPPPASPNITAYNRGTVFTW
jgi:Tfp pilus assembly protein PilX